MIIRRMLRLAATVAMVGAGVHGHATDQSPPPMDVPVSQDAEAAHQVGADQVRHEWRLDPAIFTDISPVNAAEIAIKLPEDQREER